MEDHSEHPEPTPEAKARALDALATGSDVVGAAGVAGVDPDSIRAWLDSDPEFITGLNRARAEQTGRLRAEVRGMASDALASLRELLSDADAPPAVRLRASLAILQAADALKAEEVGPTTVQEVRSQMSRRELFAGLGF